MKVTIKLTESQVQQLDSARGSTPTLSYLSKKFPFQNISIKEPPEKRPDWLSELDEFDNELSHI
jgi:hypothetical protein